MSWIGLNQPYGVRNCRSILFVENMPAPAVVGFMELHSLLLVGHLEKEGKRLLGEGGSKVPSSGIYSSSANFQYTYFMK